jgi:plastocyanin
MKPSVLLCLGVLCCGAAARAGSITGIVTAKGPAGSDTSAGTGYDSLRYKFAEKVDYDHLQDFVVYVDQPVDAPVPPSKTPPVVTQRNVSFDPHVLAVAVGTRVSWPNADEIYHNIFSMSDAKSFDLGFYDKGATKDITFDKPGRVDVYCSIHAKMHCIVLVLPSAFFAKVNANGKYTIANLPAGTYRIRAWQERLPSQEKEITVPEVGQVRLDFTLGFGDLPKY